MILDIFVVLFCVSLSLLIVGHFMRMDALRISAFAIMFLLSIVMLTNTLTYHDGDVITTVGNSTVITPQYTTFVNHTISFLFAIISVVGIIFVMVERRRQGDDEE